MSRRGLAYGLALSLLLWALIGWGIWVGRPMTAAHDSGRPAGPPGSACRAPNPRLTEGARP
jgi:hypothetical protein